MEVQLTRKGFLDLVKFKSISKSKFCVVVLVLFVYFLIQSTLLQGVSKILTSESKKENFLNSFNKED